MRRRAARVVLRDAGEKSKVANAGDADVARRDAAHLAQRVHVEAMPGT